jgi:hypothetical protein
VRRKTWVAIAGSAVPSEAAPKKERAAAFSEADCPVCYSNIVRIIDSLTPEEKKDGLAVEEKVQKYCDKVCAPPRAFSPLSEPLVPYARRSAGRRHRFCRMNTSGRDVRWPGGSARTGRGATKAKVIKRGASVGAWAASTDQGGGQRRQVLLLHHGCHRVEA